MTDQKPRFDIEDGLVRPSARIEDADHSTQAVDVSRWSSQADR